MRQRTANLTPGRVIGILGCEPGMGVTHLSIAIANYIGSKLKKRVLLVELNRQNTFVEIQKAYEGIEDEILLSRRFTIYDTDYYRNALSNEVVSILNEPYCYFVIDMGNNWRENREEFLRSDRKLLVGSLTEWRRKHFALAAAALQKEGNRFKGLAFLGLDEDVKYFSRQYDMDVMPVPVIQNPFALSKQQFSFFDALL